MKCINCEIPITDRNAHNGRPLFEGKVCALCNDLYVIPNRIAMLFKQRTLKDFEEFRGFDK